MSENIFLDTAPAYFRAGLSIIPLHIKEKKPIPNDWSRFAETKVDDNTFASWITGNPRSNIGLVLGPQSGMSMIDIDTDEKKVYDAIMSCLPPSPWHRKGKKGLMLAYRFSGLKTFRIKNISGQTMVECLSSRTQCVLPPSIHPDTQQPYVSNCELLDVKDTLVPLPDNIEEILRAAIKDAGVELSHSGWTRVTDYVAAGSRDTSLTELAGLFAYAIVRGERTLKEAIGMLQAYYNEYVETVAGDQIDIEKHIQNLIKFLHRDVLDKGKVLPKGWDAGYTPEELTQMGVTLGVEQTEWAFDEIRNYLKNIFETHSVEGKERGDGVETVLARIAKSQCLSRIDEDRLLQYITDVSGLGIRTPTLKARLKELRLGSIKGNDHNEIARAILNDITQYNLVRYHGGELMKWGGSHWVLMDNTYIKALLSKNYGHLDACRRHSDITGIMQILMFIAEQGICTKPIRGINFANGFLTQELRLIPHDPEFGMTYTMPFRYVLESAGKFPLFQDFLHRSWSRDEDYQQKVDALQEAMAITMFGLGSKFQRAILLHGAPQSGKSQLLRIVSSLVPPEGKCSVPPNDWGDKYLPGQMAGKILNICGELSEHKKIDGQSFKDIIDGTERSVQHKYGAIFQMTPTLTHWFASNHIPKSGDTSRGFIRRWLFLLFNYPVSESEKKVDIGDIIASEEREAIVSWAAQAMPRLLKSETYMLPKSHLLIENDFANLNNSVRFYLTESKKVKRDAGETQFVTEFNIYQSYWAFCAGTGGGRAVSIQRFRAIMREMQQEFGFKLDVSASRAGDSEAVYHGLMLIN